MKKILKFATTLAIVLPLLGLTAPHTAAAAGKNTAKKPAQKPAPLCVTQLHVIKGCSACETMQTWLKAGGVKLDVANIEQGSYKLYPTVVYSDKTVDHGEKMYEQKASIPSKLCVISCSVGTE